MFRKDGSITESTKSIKLFSKKVTKSLNILVYLCMKTAIFFLFTTFISIACLEAALGSKHPVILYIVGFGVWALFAWYCSARMKKRAERRNMERQFNDFMRANRHQQRF